MKATLLLLLAIASSLASAFAANEDIKAEIIVPGKKVTTEDIIPVYVRLTNTGKSAVRLMPPNAYSSFTDWPRMNVSALDSIGIYHGFSVCGNDSGAELTGDEILKLINASEARAGRKWPADYLVTLRPGESFQTDIVGVFQAREEGQLTIRFQYIMPPATASRLGLEYPRDAWSGIIRAKDLVLQVKPAPKAPPQKAPAIPGLE